MGFLLHSCDLGKVFIFPIHLDPYYPQTRLGRSENVPVSRKFLFVLLTSAVTLTTVLVLPKMAAANALPEAGHSNLVMTSRISGQEQHPDLVRLRDKISEVDNLNEARTLALTPTIAAIGALKNARSIMPFSEDLRLAEARLAATHSRIEAANTPQQVANEFSGMMLAGLDNDKAASVKMGKVGCSYSTGEVIAIVVGLILGIIPGLILLIVLC